MAILTRTCEKRILYLFTCLIVPVIHGCYKDGQWSCGETSNCTVAIDNNEEILNCNDRGFLSLPRVWPASVTVIYMRSNNISYVPAGAFKKLKHLKELDLSENRAFLSFHQDSFKGLNFLNKLSLKKIPGISFGCQQGSSKLFRHTPQLQTLLMRKCGQFDTSCVNSTFRDLPNLRYLSITWPSSPLPRGFSLLTQLDILDLSESTFNQSEDNFKALSNLTISRLALRQIWKTEFNKHVLKPVIHNVKALDFSCNLDDTEVEANYFSSILESLENSTVLEILIMDNCKSHRHTVNFSCDGFYPLRRAPLKALSLRRYRIAVLASFVRYLKHLEYLNLDCNTLVPLRGCHQNMWLDLLSLSHLKEFHCNHQHAYAHDTVTRFCDDEDVNEIFLRNFSGETIQKSKTNPVKVAVLRSEGPVLKGAFPMEKLSLSETGIPDFLTHASDGKPVYEFNISDFTTEGWRIQLKNNITFLNLSSNRFFSKIDIVIYGLDSLKTVDISNNNIEFAKPNLFRAFRNLEQLFASRNSFGLLPGSRDLANMFSGLQKIKIIDLSSNRISTLPDGMFSHCPRLQRIDLQRNGMKSVNLKFAGLNNLKFLDFSHNEIRRFTKEQTIDLKHVRFMLQMNNNSGFQCSCEHLPFMEWIQSNSADDTVVNKGNLTCQFEDGRKVSLTEVDLDQLHLHCIQEMTIIIGSTMLIAMCTGLIMWRYQRYVKYWLYMLRYKRRRDLFNKPLHRNDAFISYSNEDYEIATLITRKLEEEGLNMFFRHRVREIGAALHHPETDLEELESSRIIIICVTDNYLKSDWSYFELHMSMHQRKSIVSVIVGDIALKKMSNLLVHLLRDGVYFKWPTSELEAIGFWKSLIEAVQSPKGFRIRKNAAVEQEIKRRDIFNESLHGNKVYISYCDEDTAIACSISRKLEEMDQVVFLRDRDAHLGAFIFDEFVRGIDSSRKSILCMTDSYLNSETHYVELELTMRRGKGFVIPVVVGDIAWEKLSKPLRHLLLDGVYFEWPASDVEANNFWKSLLKAVTTPTGLRVREKAAIEPEKLTTSRHLMKQDTKESMAEGKKL